MEQNIGRKDKVARIAIGLALLVGAYLASGWLVWAFAIVGVMLLITAFTGFCGLYTLFGWNTCPIKAAPKAAKKKKR